MPAFPKPTATETDPVASPAVTTLDGQVVHNTGDENVYGAKQFDDVIGAHGGVNLTSTGDDNHRLAYDETKDGPRLKGYAGGILGVGSDTVLEWFPDGHVEVSGDLETAGGSVDTRIASAVDLAGSRALPTKAWVTATAYLQGQMVTNGGHTYTANDAHTSGATFAGDLAGHWTLLPVTKGDVGLGNVDNTADTDKPVSSATAAALAAAGVGTTKRASMVLSGDGIVGYTGNPLNVCQRTLVSLPVSTTRWRLRYKNGAVYAEAGIAGAIRIRGIAIGTPDWSEVDSQGRWSGKLGTVASTIAAASSPSNGNEYVSEWISSGALQFVAGREYALSIGLDSNGATQTHWGENKGGVGFSGTGCSDLWNDTTTVAGAGYTNPSNLWKGSVIIEYETVTTAKHVVVIGDSIAGGYPYLATSAAVNGSHPIIEAWPAIMGLDHGVLVTNMSVASLTTANWLLWITSPATGGQKWNRVDTATTPPDVVIDATGSNDLAVAGRTAANVIADKILLAAAIRTKWPNSVLAWATIIPRNGITGGQETDRQTVNDWLRNTPQGAVGVIDLDTAIRLQATPASAETAFMGGTDPHPKRGGQHKMASVAKV